MIILQNAVLYPQGPEMPVMSALAVEDGRIIDVGNLQALLGSNTKRAGNKEHARMIQFDSLRSEWENLSGDQAEINVVDLAGRVLIPGLTDAHIHLEHYALGLAKVDCETDTKEECLQRVKQRALTTPTGGWILGHGWNQNNWPGGFGSAADLDAVAGDIPVFLTAKSLHAGWANRAALRLAGISASSPDPDGGRIGRDRTGEPDGILYESAMSLVAEVVPEPNLEVIVQSLKTAQSALWQMGLTGVHDFDRRRCFSALQILKGRGELGLRVVKSIPLDDLSHAAALGLRTGFGDDWLRIGSIKAFADGALGPQTAAMLQSYEGEPGSRGMLLLDGEELYEHGRLAVENGLSLAVHAIGDRANHEVLNAIGQLRNYEKGFPQAGTLRHRIEHVQLIHAQDVGRLAELGVIASMQPIHAPSDMLMADRFWGERAALSYAWRAQLQNGARLVFGSDAPVESPNPFWGLHAAVTRQRQDGSPGPQGWYPEQRLTFAEALEGFTSGPAYAAGMEDRLGKLAAGFLADLLVLDVDPFKSSPDDLWKIQPSATLVGGDWKFIR